MSVVSILKSQGGVAPVSALLTRGASQYRIAAAIGRGEVIRPRRGWLALPGADRELLYAATHGVVLSCVSQARRLGLWTMRVGPRHVAASTAARAEAPGCVVHWGRPVVPRIPGKLEDPIHNVLQYVAACQPAEHALVIWESALNKRMVDLASLSRLPFRGPARHLREVSRPYSDSGLETLAVSRLRWLRVPLLPQAHLFGHRVDLLIGERLVLQMDGADHTGEQRDQDNDFDAFLKLRGYHVIRVGYAQVIYRWHEVQLQVMEAVAQGLHRA